MMRISIKMKMGFITSMIAMFLTISDGSMAMECATDLSMTYLDAAIDMMKKVKEFYPPVTALVKAADCDDLLNLGFNESGIYTVWPRSRVMEGRSLEVYCDMTTDGGGWTLIQRRGDFNRSSDFFFKDWKSYKEGFGDLDKDFWLGNDNIFAISNQKLYSARFDLKDVQEESRYAHYDSFWIDDENHKYTLHIKDYRGDAGDSMYPKHDNQKFSTKDNKNDNWGDHEGGCAVAFKGAWWYNRCHDSNLNGLYLKGKHGSQADGVNWKSWKGHNESLEGTEIKLRPTDSKRDRKRMTPQ